MCFAPAIFRDSSASHVELRNIGDESEGAKEQTLPLPKNDKKTKRLLLKYYSSIQENLFRLLLQVCLPVLSSRKLHQDSPQKVGNQDGRMIATAA